MSEVAAEVTEGRISPEKAAVTMAAALNEALHHEMRTDPSVIVIGEDIGAIGGLFRVTAGLANAYPDRIFDTPIAEGGLSGMGVGAAMAGHRVVVEIQIIDFLWLAADQVANAGFLHLCSGGQVSVPIVFRGPCGFGTGFGVTHSQHLEAVFAGRPGLKVVMPSTPADAKGLLTSSIRDPNPVVFFEESTLYFERGESIADGEAIPIGVGRVARAGTACTVASAGRGMKVSLEAARLLSDEGIEIEVVDLRSLKPVDWSMLTASTAKTKHFVAALDGPSFCSYASYLASGIAARSWGDLAAQPVALGGLDIGGTISVPAEALLGITAESIAATVRKLLS